MTSNLENRLKEHNSKGSKEFKTTFSTINARSEGIEAKLLFRGSFNNQRCLVPANGFYEWDKKGKEKVPYFIHLKKRELFAFAGLWDYWKDAEGKEFKSYTILTCKPNSLIAKIHDRMPVILPLDKEKIWVDVQSKQELLKNVLIPYPESEMEAFPVSTLVNKPQNDGKNLVLKIK
jgi:putative SOS response-associated peptidase YedK